MATYYYPKRGQPKTVYFDITGRRPDPEEAQRLRTVPFAKKPLSSEEAKNALKWFAIGVVAAVAMWFFGRWVIANFIGPGVLFFGYGGAYLAAPISAIFGISSFFKLFRSGCKKTPQVAFKWVWETSYFGEDGVGVRFGKLNYAVATLDRAVPAGAVFDKEAVSRYIQYLRDTLAQAMDETTLPARKEPPAKDWRESGALKSVQIDGCTELAPGVAEVAATISYKDVITRSLGNNKSYDVIAAILELRVTEVFLQAGKYWYPYDLTPVVTRAEAPAALPEEAAAAAALPQ